MLTLDEIKTTIAFDQPKLRASACGSTILVEGSYPVFEEGVLAAPDGRITEFDIKMEFPNHYPSGEPKVSDGSWTRGIRTPEPSLRMTRAAPAHDRP